MEKSKRILRALIALSIIPGFGCRRVVSLLKEIQEPETVFALSKRKLCSIPGIGEASALALLSFDGWDRVDEILEQSSKITARIISLADPLYPPLLKQIYDPPILLWVRGDPRALSYSGIAVVGTRTPSAYGRDCAIKFSAAISKAEISVISGLAYGIDTFSHQSTLDHGSVTVAVLGSGIDFIYPQQNIGLAKQIIEKGGAIVTEYPPGTKPDAGNFPVRNRIVSGLSLGVLVVESGLKGGSMITADLALDQNREVFAIPHMVGRASGAGGNHLIKRGAAKLVENLDDILQELSIQYDHKVSDSAPKSPGWRALSLDKLAIQICEILEKKSFQIDDLRDEMGMDTPELLVQLLQLELNGIVEQKAGKVFSLK